MKHLVGILIGSGLLAASAATARAALPPPTTWRDFPIMMDNLVPEDLVDVASAIDVELPPQAAILNYSIDD